MTDNNATERLRAILDERSVEYETYSYVIPGSMEYVDVTRIRNVAGRITARFMSCNEPGKVDVACKLTPEQAVAATLGAGECENKKLRGQIETLVAYVESDGTKYYVDDEGNQHFDHAATLGAGECKVVMSSTDGLCTDNPKHWFKLSCGHSFTVDGLKKPVACAVCGKAVRNAEH